MTEVERLEMRSNREVRFDDGSVQPPVNDWNVSEIVSYTEIRRVGQVLLSYGTDWCRL